MSTTLTTSSARPQQMSTTTTTATTASGFSPATPQTRPTSGSAPNTPTQRPSPSPSTPGKWQHPRLDEIIRRRDASTFDSRNLHTFGLNMTFLIGSFVLPALFQSTLQTNIFPDTTTSSYILRYATYLIRSVLILNMLLSLTPLFRPRDTCDDIPLTDTQRTRLALPPRSRPASPAEIQSYVTPPRYSRSATPGSGNSTRGGAQGSESPLGRGLASPLENSLRRESFNSTRRLSPLNANGSGSGVDHRRRLSFQTSGRSSPSEFEAWGGSVGSVGTPTKSGKASVGLNSKWLYEKGRGSPRGAASGSGLAGFGGGGSVFG